MRDVELSTNIASPEVREIFSKEGLLKRILLVESAIAEAHAQIGNIPMSVAQEIRRVAMSGAVTWTRIRELDQQTKHPMMALVKATAEACRDGAGEYVHLAVGTSEVTDTAFAVQIKDYYPILLRKLIKIAEILLEHTDVHRKTIMPGRSLGQQIQPLSLGLRVAVWAREICRHLQRLDECSKRILVGMLRGPVGSRAEQVALGGRTLELEDVVLGSLGLGKPEATDQILQRDRHAEFIGILTLVACTLDKVAWNIRTLQRTEVGELEEPFDDKEQVGSSAAPHKRNPRYSELICGFAIWMRSNVLASFEAIRNEHERDSSGAVPDRVALWTAGVVLDEMLELSRLVLSGLNVRSEKMKENLLMTQGRIMSSAILAALVKAGYGRQQAHAIVRQAAMRSFRESRHIKEILQEDERLKNKLGEGVLDNALRPEHFLGDSNEQIELVLRVSKSELSDLRTKWGLP